MENMATVLIAVIEKFEHCSLSAPSDVVIFASRSASLSDRHVVM